MLSHFEPLALRLQARLFDVQQEALRTNTAPPKQPSK